MANIIIPITNNTQFRYIMDMLDAETDKNVRLGVDSTVYVKMTKWDYAKLIPEEINGDHTKDFSQFFTRLSTKFPNIRYVAIGRSKKAYLNDNIKTGNYEYVAPWLLWKWLDYFTLDNALVYIPQLEE